MAHEERVAAKVEELRNLIEGVAKNIAIKSYGEAGPEWGTQFTEIEDLACEVGDRIAREIVAQTLTRQAQAAGESHVCEVCGREKPPAPSVEEEVEVTTRRGKAKWKAPKAYCKRCRQAFFPASGKARR
jgi:hypothetical protein